MLFAAPQVKKLEDGHYEVRLRYTPVIAVEQVLVFGSFNDWDRKGRPLSDEDGDGAYDITLTLPAGRHSYKFIVNGDLFKSDPENPDREPDGYGGYNSVLALGVPLDGAGSPADASIDVSALAHQAAHARYAHQPRPGEITLRLHARRGDLAAAALVGRGRRPEPLRQVARLGALDVWEITRPLKRGALRYAFQLQSGERKLIFDAQGAAEKYDPERAFFFDPAQRPRFETPEWVRDAVFYQIFPDRYANSDRNRDAEWVQPWGAKPTIENFFGGDLQGIIDHLDDLQALGVTALYLNPIFLAPSNHKYDTSDYLKIDPSFGDEALFAKLCEALRARGMRLILDGVFNHTGDSFWAFEDIKKRGQASKYKDWYFIHSFPVRVQQNPNYEAWWGFGSLPKLNTQNPEVRKHLLEVGTRWLKLGADGWRLDVPNEVPHDFWIEFRRALRRVKPEAYIVGEIWTDGMPWLQGDQFDAIMNYQLRQAVLGFMRPGGESAEMFGESLQALLHAYPLPAIEAGFNLLGSHDTARLRTALGGDLARVKLAAALIFAWPGAPVIYYGDEVGLDGGKDPDCRRCYPWDPAKQDLKLKTFYAELARIRSRSPELRRGEVLFEPVDPKGRCLAFRRALGEVQTLVAVNAGDIPAAVEFGQVAGRWRDMLSGREYAARGKGLALDLPALSAIFLKRVDAAGPGR